MTRKPAETGELLAPSAEGEGPQVPALRSDNPIAAMLQSLVDKGVTAENAAALEKVCDLYVKMDAVVAKKAFAEAKAQLQAELPVVAATDSVDNKDGTIRYVFAPYEDIMEAVKPYLVRHGFSVSFTMNAEEGRMEAVCTLTHTAGHSEANRFSVRVGSGPHGCSEAQSDGAARSYARRGALCDALNIVVDKDTDARLEGGFISAEKAVDFMKRVEAAGIEVEDFLRLAEAESFKEIRQGKLPVLEQVLREKASHAKGDSLGAVKVAWAKAKYGDQKKPPAETMRADFGKWVESILQKDVPNADALSDKDVKDCLSWLRLHGAELRPQA